MIYALFIHADKFVFVLDLQFFVVKWFGKPESKLLVL